MKPSGHFDPGTAAPVGVAALVAAHFDAPAQGANAVASDGGEIGSVVRGRSGGGFSASWENRA
jgi:hypothetical protein